MGPEPHMLASKSTLHLLLRCSFSQPDKQHNCRTQNGRHPDYTFSKCPKNH